MIFQTFKVSLDYSRYKDISRKGVCVNLRELGTSTGDYGPLMTFLFSKICILKMSRDNAGILRIDKKSNIIHLF